MKIIGIISIGIGLCITPQKPFLGFLLISFACCLLQYLDWKEKTKNPNYSQSFFKRYWLCALIPCYIILVFLPHFFVLSVTSIQPDGVIPKRMQVSKPQTITFNYMPKQYDASRIVCTSSDQTIAKISLHTVENGSVTYQITPIQSGTITISCNSGSVSSTPIDITIFDEIPAESEQPNQEVIQQEKQGNASMIVYITKSGKRYHYKNNCSSGTYYPTTLQEAKINGLTPCSRCT